MDALSRLGTVEPSPQTGGVSGIGSFPNLGAVVTPGPLPGSESLSADGRGAVLGWRPDALRPAGLARGIAGAACPGRCHNVLTQGYRSWFEPAHTAHTSLLGSH